MLCREKGIPADLNASPDSSPWHDITRPRRCRCGGHKSLHAEYLSNRTCSCRRDCWSASVPVVKGLIARLPDLLADDWPPCAQPQSSWLGTTSTWTRDLAMWRAWPAGQAHESGRSACHSAAASRISSGSPRRTSPTSATPTTAPSATCSTSSVREMWQGPASAQNSQRLEDAGLIGLFFANGLGGTKTTGDSVACARGRSWLAPSSLCSRGYLWRILRDGAGRVILCIFPPCRLPPLSDPTPHPVNHTRPQASTRTSFAVRQNGQGSVWQQCDTAHLKSLPPLLPSHCLDDNHRRTRLYAPPPCCAPIEASCQGSW